MILGLVSWLQPVHGYDVRRELESWHADEWANIAPGSIYHALRKMADEGMLEEVSTQRVGARPARTTYRTTTRGEAEFTQLLWRYWWEYQPPFDPFLAAFAFLPRLGRVEAVAALRNRARVLRALVEMRRVTLATEFMRAQKPAHVTWQFELVIDRMEAEIAWCERIAARIEGGAELFPPTMAGWPNAGASDSGATDDVSGAVDGDSGELASDSGALTGEFGPLGDESGRREPDPGAVSDTPPHRRSRRHKQ